MNILMGVAPAPVEDFEYDASDAEKVEKSEKSRAVAPAKSRNKKALSIDPSSSTPSNNQLQVAAVSISSSTSTLLTNQVSISVNSSSSMPSSNQVKSLNKLPSPSSSTSQAQLGSSGLVDAAEYRGVCGVSDGMDWESDPIQDWFMEENSILADDEGICIFFTTTRDNTLTLSLKKAIFLSLRKKSVIWRKEVGVEVC